MAMASLIATHKNLTADLTEHLKGFSLSCEICKSENVNLEVDCQPPDSMKVTVECKDCESNVILFRVD